MLHQHLLREGFLVDASGLNILRGPFVTVLFHFHHRDLWVSGASRSLFQRSGRAFVLPDHRRRDWLWQFLHPTASLLCWQRLREFNLSLRFACSSSDADSNAHAERCHRRCLLPHHHQPLISRIGWQYAVVVNVRIGSWIFLGQTRICARGVYLGYGCDVLGLIE